MPCHTLTRIFFTRIPQRPYVFLLYCSIASGKINVVVSYEGFNLASNLEEMYSNEIETLQNEIYGSAKRYTGQAFQRARLKTSLSMDEWDAEHLFDKFDTRRDGVISFEELRDGLEKHFHMTLSPEKARAFGCDDNICLVDRERFVQGVKTVLQDGES